MNRPISSFKLAAFLIMAAALVGGYYLVDQKINNRSRASVNYENYQLNEEVPEINSAADLQVELQQLDAINVEQIDSTLNANDTDSSSL